MHFVDGTVTHLRTVVVDGAGRASEEIGYLLAVSDAQSQKGVDSQLFVQQRILLEHDLLIWFQQCVEVRHESRVEVEEDRVEVPVERFRL